MSQKRGMVSLSLWRISSLLIVCGCEAVSCQRGVGGGGGGGGGSGGCGLEFSAYG